ncbi:MULTISPECIES: tetratricopeptide repeat protein [unclassified Bacillus (in: firmicutes)]|uniref:tetratricopeptide repeat protein n=1 Tax=unclassified Bacillus (in: firmicutes) TaxID=185979 RepID=UPI001BEBD5C5|nr:MULTISPECIES: tetratricopeptide repeat protein [unclassified Bacillus (in: firmicutes)]MBT2637846.1 tetratricopeptide repeat protein [Bacillus sp. ISL-39]MBT2659757.1 tetratricopeptide repeat protein [Bacillus sp. ISL-45]
MGTIIKEKEFTQVRYLFSMGRYEEAAVHIRNILEEDPFNSNALYNMAVVFMSRSDFTSARETCMEAMEHGHDKAICYHFIGKTYSYQKDYYNAEQTYLRALEIEPENGELLATYGYLMLVTGFEEKALNLLEHALELEPDSERVNQYVLEYYFVKKDSEKQLELIRNIMDSAGDEQQKLMNLALYHDLQGNMKDAREYYRQAFLVDPSNQYLLSLLAYYDEMTHPLFAPHRIMKKIGGPAIIWIIFMALSLLLYYVGQYKILLTAVAVYLVFVMYTWIATQLYKWFVNRRL